MTYKALLDIHAVSPDKPYTWASGLEVPNLHGQPPDDLLPRCASSHLQRDGGTDQPPLFADADVIAGTATAGIPHAAWVAQEMGLPMVVRSKPKDHGQGHQVGPQAGSEGGRGR